MTGINLSDVEITLLFSFSCHFMKQSNSSRKAGTLTIILLKSSKSSEKAFHFTMTLELQRPHLGIVTGIFRLKVLLSLICALTSENSHELPKSVREHVERYFKVKLDWKQRYTQRTKKKCLCWFKWQVIYHANLPRRLPGFNLPQNRSRMMVTMINNTSLLTIDNSQPVSHGDHTLIVQLLIPLWWSSAFAAGLFNK